MSIKTLSTKQADTIEANDLLIEILLRLPSRSIYRIRTTCKQWHSIITDSVFRKLWRKRNIKLTTGLILRCRYKNALFLSDKSKTIPSLLLLNKLKVEQSCNGLLLCRSGPGYHVYNPTKDTSSDLPKLPKLKGETYSSMTLAFDPYLSPSYQVISCANFYGRCNNLSLQIHVYASGTRCWTLVFKKNIGCYLTEGVYWNGSMHWISALLYFDIGNQTLKAMPAPPDTWNMNRYFGESCGRLNYATVSTSTTSYIIDVYELKTDYSQWVLKYNVLLQNHYNHTFSVLSVVHDADEDDSFLVLMIGLKVVRYNLVSKTSEELYVLSPGTNVRAFPYIELNDDTLQSL